MVEVAVVGTGNIAPAHLEPYTTFGDRCTVVALCDLVPGRDDGRVVSSQVADGPARTD